MTAEIDVPDEGAKGVIVSQGGRFGGWSIYAKEGRPVQTPLVNSFVTGDMGMDRAEADALTKDALVEQFG